MERIAKFSMLRKNYVALSLFCVSLLVAGCNNSVTGPSTISNGQTNIQTADKQAITQIAEQDSAVSSFETNFNENQSINFLGKESTAITPVFVWQHIILKDKNYTFNQVGDSVFVKVTKTFQGVVNIVASTQGPTTKADTIITKNFTTVITRQLLFERIDSTDNPYRNWRLVGISLVSGGTMTNNFNINKLTVTGSDGNSLVIDSPEDYFLAREKRWGWWHHFPEIAKRDSITISVELYSAYADTDFVTVTYGANFFGMHRNKSNLSLVSSTPSGNGYLKVYQKTFNVGGYHGYFHAVLNAFTKQTIYDDSAQVESQTWGIPYKVKN